MKLILAISLFFVGSQSFAAIGEGIVYSPLDVYLHKFYEDRNSSNMEFSDQDAKDALEFFGQKEGYSKSNQALQTPFKYAQNYFALVHYDDQNNTNFAYEAGLLYIQNYQYNIYADVRMDPIFADINDQLSRRIFKKDIHRVFETLSQSSDLAILNFTRNSIHGVFSFLLSRLKDIEDPINPTVLSRLAQVNIENDYAVLNSKNPHSELLTYGHIAAVAKASIGFFEALKQPLLVRFYTNHLIKAELALEQIRKQDKEKNIATKLKSDSQVLQGLARSLTVSQSAEKADVVRGDSLTRISKIVIQRTENSGNVFQFKKTQGETLYQIKVINADNFSHETFMEAANYLLDDLQVGGLLFDDYGHIPRELESANYQQFKYGKNQIIVRKKAIPMCAPLFQ